MERSWSRRRLLAALAAAPGLVLLGGGSGCGRERGPGRREAVPVPGAPTSSREPAPAWPGDGERAHAALVLLERAAERECRDFPVSEQLHARQAATRALLAAPQDEELVVAALCHDLGGLVGSPHARFSARLLAGHVRPELQAVVAHHAVFRRRFRASAPRRAREAHRRFRDEPWYDLALRFSEELDEPSFDRGYESLPVAELEPRLRRVFARRPYPAYAPAALAPPRSALRFVAGS